MEKQKLIDQFNKNSVEVVKVQIHEWKSQKYVDIRAWYIEDPVKNIAKKASHKGLTLINRAAT